MGMTNIRDVVRPALLEVDRAIVQLRAHGCNELAEDLTILRDIGVRSVRWHIDQQARDANTAHVKQLVELMRAEVGANVEAENA